jgi:hypothetical protein
MHWILGWAPMESREWAAYNLAVIVSRPRTGSGLPAEPIRVARVEYDRLEPAGSITAIAVDRAPNAAVDWARQTLVVRWGASSGLNPAALGPP